MALTENHVGIFLFTFLTFMIFLVPTTVNAVTSVEDGKWDFTITDIKANQTDNGILVRIAVDFEGTERMGTADVILLSDDDRKITKTISNLKQIETRWIEFDIQHGNDDYCIMNSVKVTLTTPGFKDGHIFDEKELFFIPYENCENSTDDGFNIIDNDSLDPSQIIPDDESAIESFEISNNILNLKKGHIQYVTIYGNIAESKFLQGHDLRIMMTKPDGVKDHLRVQVTSEGKFETVLRFDFDHSTIGTYTFEPTYMEKYKTESIDLIVAKSL